MDDVFVAMTGPAMDQQSPAVLAWWMALSAVSVVNIALWGAEVIRLRRRTGGAVAGATRVAAPGALPILAAVFVFGCAFRAFLPRAEAQRICLYDSWISSAVLGRSVATVAELCLVAQWTLVLGAWSVAAGSALGVGIARVLLPLIAVAELFSWYTALTANFIGSVFEESIWAASATLVTLALVALWRRHDPRGRHRLGVFIVLNAAYVVFMCTVDVPMYVARWKADQASGAPTLSLREGARDAAVRRRVTRRWEDWRQEMPWMSLYFSAGVWISIGLMAPAPFVRRRPEPRTPPRA
ncbi:MAG: hypothetical protein ABUS79_00810 [Pseudomonadota bacterium]